MPLDHSQQLHSSILKDIKLLMGHQGTCVTSRNQCKVFQSVRFMYLENSEKCILFCSHMSSKNILSCIILSSHHYLLWEPHNKKYRTKHECYKVNSFPYSFQFEKLHLAYSWVQGIKKIGQKLFLPLFLNLKTSEAWIRRLKCRSAFVPFKTSSMSELGTQFILDQIRTKTWKNSLGFWAAEDPSIPRLSKCWCCTISEEEARLG